MKAYLIELLRDHDVPKYRTQNAWSKETWTSIVGKFNQRFDLSFTVIQLIYEIGFGWDHDRKMVVARDNVWAALETHKNKGALTWRGRSFPYYEDLFALYDVVMAWIIMRTKQHNPHGFSITFTTIARARGICTPTPAIHAHGDSSMQFHIEEDSENTNWLSSNNTFSQVEVNSTQGNDLTLHTPQVEAIPISSTPTVLMISMRDTETSKEEIDRYAAIEEEIKGPFSIKKCIKALERLEGLSM
ncbi:hypothetical protein ZWY2020_048143 [Hordeum vulgare]|nr:hypothetical protein ZWY2020_048143 [Hordeum vulgare]